MATGTGNLPNPSMSFSPFAILTAEEMNNILENINALADGTGIGDGSVGTSDLANLAVTTGKLANASVTSDKVDFTTLLPSLFTAFGASVQSYTNTGSGGGTGYYVNLGGIKLCWGRTNAINITNNSTSSISYPASFFNSIQGQSVTMGYGSIPADGQLSGTISTSSFSVFITTGGASGTISITWITIGT